MKKAFSIIILLLFNFNATLANEDSIKTMTKTEKESKTKEKALETGVERSLFVDAPVKDVWDQSLDVNTWPEWIPFIKRASFEGDELELGSTFRISMKFKGIALPFRLSVCEYEEHKKIAWTTSIGSVKVTRWLIFEEKEGRTLVTSREEFKGALAGYIFPMVGEESLNSIHDEWLLAIKEHVEGNLKSLK